MARSHIPEEASPYYPPRARWYGPLLGWGSALCRRTRLDRIHLPAGVTTIGLLGSFFIPGLGVYLRGPLAWGLAAFGAWGLTGMLSLVWFGHTAGHFAFGLLQAIHTISFVYYCQPLLRPAEFKFRVLFTLLALLVISGLIYLPMRRTIQSHWPTPWRVNEHEGSGHTRFPAGGSGAGGPENHWFVRLELDISGHGNAGEANISTARVPSTTTQPAQFAREPLPGRFWRRPITA